MFLSIKWQPVLFILDLDPKLLLKLFCQVLNCTEKSHITDYCNCTINYQIIRRGQYPVIVGIFYSYQWQTQNKSLRIFRLSGPRMQGYLECIFCLVSRWGVQVFTVKWIWGKNLPWSKTLEVKGQAIIFLQITTSFEDVDIHGC